ncbi:MAG: hypothetical protein IKH03_02370 [Oscillospiraceae bacterium]|nr:hypothetical protein [Oscillospiraceae bacterium]
MAKNNIRTSAKAATAASKTLQKASASKDAKTAAASALTNRKAKTK